MRFKRKFCKLSGLIAEPVRGVCPEGWHLPTEEEFKILVSSAGGGEVAGKVLKFTSFNGTNAYGFGALPAGNRDYNGSFDYAGNRAYFWSAAENDSEFAYFLYMGYNGVYARQGADYKTGAFSVRCLKD